MRPEDLRELADRRYALVERQKAEFWVSEKARLTPAEALRIADGLRVHARAVNPAWPSDAERAEDLEMHAVVARKLRLASGQSGR